MLTRNGAKLLDFGLAKIARGVARSEMKLVGTPFYIAPEQISGLGPVDACCNIFFFGAIFYEMATGVSPFPAVEMRSFLLAVVGSGPVPPVQLNPQIPDDLQRIIVKCLEKERHKRYQSATETLSDLKRLRTSMEFSTSSLLRSTNH